MKQRKKCKPCSAGCHSGCTGESGHQDGRECPCCGQLSAKDRADKEEKVKTERAQEKYERDYGQNAGVFDSLIRRKKAALGIEDPVELLGHLPEAEPEIKSWAKEAGLTVKWLKFFLNEYRQDYAVGIRK